MSVAGLLEPRFWELEQAPPGPGALRPQAKSADPPHPALLLIDRRGPLAPPLRAEFTASLSSAELRRLDALHRPDDRERFLLGRAALRRWLGAWLERSPAAVAIECAPHGKPRCPGGPEFNVSHSGDLILLALHPRRPVGVDVERARPGLDWRPIARRMLPAAECEALTAEGFQAAWCRLEARLKAGGRGLTGHGDPPPRGLLLWDVAVPAGYRAAVALAPPAQRQ
jgi:4'-phosphopantetheinyl transferase